MNDNNCVKHVCYCRSLHSQQADGGTGTEPGEQVATYQQPGLDYSLQRRDTTPVYPHMIASTQHIQSEYSLRCITVVADTAICALTFMASAPCGSVEGALCEVGVPLGQTVLLLGVG